MKSIVLRRTKHILEIDQTEIPKSWRKEATLGLKEDAVQKH
jgi:hypothetical protein